MDDLIQYSDEMLSLDVLPKGKLFCVYFDSNVGKLRIICSNYELFEQLREAFSAENPGSFFSHQYGYTVDNKIWQINKFGYLSNGPGLIFDILQWIKTFCGSLDVVQMSNNCKRFIFDFLAPLKKSFPEGSFEISNIADDSGRNSELVNEGKRKFEFREYQKNAIWALLFKAHGRGLIELPTASGKSFVISNFIWNINKNVNRNYRYLILVPNKQLVEQFYSDLLDYGYNRYQLTKFTAGLKKSEAFNPEAMIVIANRQYVFKNMEKLPKIDALIADEVHQTVSDSTSEFINGLDCKIKVGCSGTIPRDKNNRWKLISMFGKICYIENIVDLQKKNYISDLEITTLSIKDNYVEEHHELLFNLHPLIKYNSEDLTENSIFFNDAYLQEVSYINKNYLNLYTPVLEYLNLLNENILVLFDKIEIGKNIFELSKKIVTNKNSYYIDGTIKVDDREKIRSIFEENGNNILFGQTSCMSTGINIKRLNHICFMFQSKGFSRVLQSIGRTLRLHEKKEKSHLIDIVFNNFKYSLKQYKERCKIYKDSYNISKILDIKKYEVNN